MHLKNLGNLYNVLDAFTKIGGGIEKVANVFQSLDQATQKYVITSGKLTKEQLLQISNNIKWITDADGVVKTVTGLTKAELDAAVATATASTAQKEATASTLGLDTAFKGLGASIKSFVLTNPGLVFATIATGVIAAGIAIYTHLHPSLQQATKDLKEQKKNFDSVSQEVDSLSKELETANERLAELQSKGSLSLVENEELSKLKETTAELETQLAIKKEEQRLEAKKTADIANKAFHGAFRSKYDDNGELITGDAAHANDSIKELENSIKAYYKLQKEYDKAKKNADFYAKETEKNGGRYSLTGKVDWAEYKKFSKQMESLQTQMNAASSQANLMYEAINGQKVAYEGLAQAGYDLNQIQLDEYRLVRHSADAYVDFCSDINDTTKAFSELNSEQKRTKLETSFILSGNSEEKAKEIVESLSDKDLDIVANLTFDNTATKESVHKAVLIAKRSTSESEESITLPLSISDTITKLDTQLRPAFDALKNSYQDIFTDDGFTLENVDISMLNSVLDVMNEMKEMDLGIDTSGFENLAKVLTDSSSTAEQVQQAFDSLASSVLNSTELTGNLTEETASLIASLLEEMGVVNAQEIVYDALNTQTEALALQKQFAAQTGYELVNAANDEVAAFLNHAGASETARTYLFQLVAAEQVFNAQGLDTSGKIAALKELAVAYGQTAIAAKIAHMEDQAAKSHTSLNESDYSSLVNEVNNAVNNVKIDFDGNAGANSAGKAGKEAADAYVEAFEKELQKLDDLKDQGKISEKQYLDALRLLYNKYYRDKKKYLDQYKKYESQYLQGMKSLYESAFSYITKQIDKRINALQSQCDAEIASLEAQKKAAADLYESQIKDIESQIKAKEKEIDAIQKAAEARKRERDLQKSLYDLERERNQRTVYLYKDGQLSHVNNVEGEREKIEDVAAKRREIQIADIEKQIDGLTEQKELLEEALEASNRLFDEQIANVQRNFDAMISGLENTKTKFEELSEVFENARMEATLQELGINMEALLSGSEEEFNKLKVSYLGILADISRGNDETLNQLSRLGGISADSISYLDSTREAFENLGSVNLENFGSEIDSLVSSSNDLAETSGKTSEAIGNIQSGVTETADSIQPLNSEMEKLKAILGEIIELFKSFEFPEIGDENYAQKLKEIADGFRQISEKCRELSTVDFSSVIGFSGSDGIESETDMESSSAQGFGGLVAAISDAVMTIDEQMNNLTVALQSGNNAFAEQIAFIQDEYIPAWEELQTRLAEIIGVGGGDSKEGGKKSQKGSSNSKEGGGKSEGSGEGSIINTMQVGGEEVAAKLEDPWLTSFNDFATGENSVQSICELINEIVTEMAQSIISQCEAASKALNDLAEKAFSVSASGGYSGNAYASGTNGPLSHDVKNALVGDGGKPELVCDPNTGQYSIFTAPAITDLNKGTTVYNGEETEKILKNSGNPSVVSGRSFANGTDKISSYLEPVTLNDSRFESVLELIERGTQMFVPPVNAMTMASESMDRMISLVKNNTVNQSGSVTIGEVILPNITNETSAHRLINELRQLERQTIQYVHRF